MAGRQPGNVLTSRLGTISVKNVTNALIWMAVPLLCGFLYLAKDPSTREFAWVLLVLLVADVGVFLWENVYFSVKDPDHLHSETHRYQMARMSRRQDQLHAHVLDAEPIISNPALPNQADPIGAPTGPLTFDQSGSGEVVVIDEGNPDLPPNGETA